MFSVPGRYEGPGLHEGFAWQQTLHEVDAQQVRLVAQEELEARHVPVVVVLGEILRAEGRGERRLAKQAHHIRRA